jgi:hypothetical protein
MATHPATLVNLSACGRAKAHHVRGLRSAGSRGLGRTYFFFVVVFFAVVVLVDFVAAVFLAGAFFAVVVFFAPGFVAVLAMHPLPSKA